MNPYAIAWKLSPWLLIVVMAAMLWGSYSYVTRAGEKLQAALVEKNRLEEERAALDDKARQDAEMLAERERMLAQANQTINAQRKAIRGFKHEGCLDLDADSSSFLDGMLSRRPAVREGGGATATDGAGPAAGEPAGPGVER